MKLNINDYRADKIYEFKLVEDDKLVSGFIEAPSLVEARVRILNGDYEQTSSIESPLELMLHKGKSIESIYPVKERYFGRNF